MFSSLSTYMRSPAVDVSNWGFLCIQGRWLLLWSSPQSDFARAKRRFGPIPTASVQLIGEAGGIEDDRAANLIQIAGGEQPVLQPASDDAAGIHSEHAST